MSSQGEQLKAHLDSEEVQENLQFKKREISNKAKFTASVDIARAEREASKAARRLKVNGILGGEKELAAAEKTRQAEEQAQQTNQPAVARPATMPATAPSGGMMQFGLKGGGAVGRTRSGAPGGGGPQPNATTTISQAPGQHFGQTTTRREETTREPAGRLQLGGLIGLNFTRPRTEVTESTETDQQALNWAADTLAAAMSNPNVNPGPVVEAVGELVGSDHPNLPEIMKQVKVKAAELEAQRQAEIPALAENLQTSLVDPKTGEPISLERATAYFDLLSSGRRDEANEIMSQFVNTEGERKRAELKVVEMQLKTAELANQATDIELERVKANATQRNEIWNRSPISCDIMGKSQCDSIKNELISEFGGDAAPGAFRARNVELAGLGLSSTIRTDEDDSIVTSSINPEAYNQLVRRRLYQDNVYTFAVTPEEATKDGFLESITPGSSREIRMKDIQLSQAELLDIGQIFQADSGLDEIQIAKRKKRLIDTGGFVEEGGILKPVHLVDPGHQNAQASLYATKMLQGHVKDPNRAFNNYLKVVKTEVAKPPEDQNLSADIGASIAKGLRKVISLSNPNEREEYMRIVGRDVLESSVGRAIGELGEGFVNEFGGLSPRQVKAQKEEEFLNIRAEEAEEDARLERWKEGRNIPPDAQMSPTSQNFEDIGTGIDSILGLTREAREGQKQRARDAISAGNLRRHDKAQKALDERVRNR